MTFILVAAAAAARRSGTIDNAAYRRQGQRLQTIPSVSRGNLDTHANKSV